MHCGLLRCAASTGGRSAARYTVAGEGENGQLPPPPPERAAPAAAVAGSCHAFGLRDVPCRSLALVPQPGTQAFAPPSCPAPPQVTEWFGFGPDGFDASNLTDLAQLALTYAPYIAGRLIEAR